MTKKLKIAIVADDPPVHKDIVASGLCRVNSHLLRGLEKNISIIICGSSEGRYSKENLAVEFESRYLIWDQENFITKLIKKVTPYFLREEIKFFLSRSHIIDEIIKSKSDFVFCPCGINPFALRRALWIAKKCNLPIAVYCVDDFLSGARLSGNIPHLLISRYFLPKWMNRIHKLFVITDGLQSRFHDLYNRDSEVFNLPYELLPPQHTVVDASFKNQIMFIGNISHFYIDGIRCMARVIESLNKSREDPITFVLTLPDKNQTEALIGSYKCIKCVPFMNDELLHQEMNKSILCFAPYSFQNKYKTMVSTSFPSKILEYLSSAKFIIAIGPEYATSIRYFSDNQLHEIISKESEEELKEVIIKQIKNRMDLSTEYQQVISRNHNPDRIAGQIISALNRKSQ